MNKKSHLSLFLKISFLCLKLVLTSQKYKQEIHKEKVFCYATINKTRRYILRGSESRYRLGAGRTQTRAHSAE